MKTLKRRVQHLEARFGTTALLPWETPGWEQWSEAEMLGELDWYIAAYPHSALARMQRDIEALTDRELEALCAEAPARLGKDGGSGTTNLL
jgi:hypothetical protein